MPKPTPKLSAIRHPLSANQKGFAALTLLIIIVFGIIIIWEANEYIQTQVSPAPSPSSSPVRQTPGSATLCLSGEQGNCNDSNDQFILE